MNLVDGALNVTVFAQGDCVEEVRIDSPRKNVAPVFVGRTPAEATILAKNLFSLCPAAQSLAVQAAGEAALGQGPDPAESRRRALRLLCERYVEMLRASILDWPQAAAPDAESVAVLRETLQALRIPPVSGEGLFERLAQAADKLGLHNFSQAETLFARQWAEVAADERNWELRHDKADFLRPSDDEMVAEAMIAPKFSLAPALPGRCAETGACARRAGEDFVNSLAGRLAARLKDMAETQDANAALAKGGSAPAELLAARRAGPGRGYAAVDSARGRLYHSLRLDGAGRIADYKIVAPTEWNFHPDGPFVRLLRGGKIGTGAAARRRVERLAFVFDPCISVGVEIRDVAHA